jgi:CDP-2,3-bis-(O-geranylgeranyl)-sn-glycerol synthase
MNDIIYLILQSFYFILPAYVANMAPVIVRKINFLKYPLDCKMKFKGKRILGTNKTFRGLVSGIIGSTIIAFVQYNLSSYTYFLNLSLLNYAAWPLIGFLMGFGAIFGDAIESFIKRRLNIAPGSSLKFWDQIDFIIGATLFISFIAIIRWDVLATIFIISPLLTVIVNYSAHYLKIRRKKW